MNTHLLTRPRLPLAVATLITLLVIGADTLNATTVLGFDADGLVSHADRIVHATCDRRESYRDDRGLIVTRYVFTVHESLKGDALKDGALNDGATSTIEFVQPGGEYRGVRLVIPGLSEHTVGDEMILFLSAASRHDARRRLPIGLDQGVYRVTTREDETEPKVRRRVGDLRIVNPSSALDSFPEDVGVATFKAAVRAKVAEQKK